MTAPEKLTLKEVHNEVVELTKRFDRLISNFRWGVMAVIAFLTLVVLYLNGTRT